MGDHFFFSYTISCCSGWPHIGYLWVDDAFLYIVFTERLLPFPITTLSLSREVLRAGLCEEAGLEWRRPVSLWVFSSASTTEPILLRFHLATGLHFIYGSAPYSNGASHNVPMYPNSAAVSENNSHYKVSREFQVQSFIRKH